MRVAGWFGIVIGLLITGQWAFFLRAGAIPELQTEPIRLGFHLAAEFVTALALIVSGVATLRADPWGRSGLLVALGMLLYTVIVSPGYFAQRGEWPLVAMFGVLLLSALVMLARLWRAGQEER
jgi:hypothetical protein